MINEEKGRRRRAATVEWASGAQRRGRAALGRAIHNGRACACACAAARHGRARARARTRCRFTSGAPLTATDLRRARGTARATASRSATRARKKAELLRICRARRGAARRRAQRGDVAGAAQHQLHVGQRARGEARLAVAEVVAPHAREARVEARRRQRALLGAALEARAPLAQRRRVVRADVLHVLHAERRARRRRHHRLHAGAHPAGEDVLLDEVRRRAVRVVPLLRRRDHLDHPQRVRRHGRRHVAEERAQELVPHRLQHLDRHHAVELDAQRAHVAVVQLEELHALVHARVARALPRQLQLLLGQRHPRDAAARALRRADGKLAPAAAHLQHVAAAVDARLVDDGVQLAPLRRVQVVAVAKRGARVGPTLPEEAREQLVGQVVVRRDVSRRAAKRVAAQQVHGAVERAAELGHGQLRGVEAGAVSIEDEQLEQLQQLIAAGVNVRGHVRLGQADVGGGGDAEEKLGSVVHANAYHGAPLASRERLRLTKVQAFVGRLEGEMALADAPGQKVDDKIAEQGVGGAQKRRVQPLAERAVPHGGGELRRRGGGGRGGGGGCAHGEGGDAIRCTAAPHWRGCGGHKPPSPAVMCSPEPVRRCIAR
ncbi:hypothetical protein FGB62_127g026 [Gracilaria domingensis]|nr:hypothetical protein FGB62_127g026 [Gracilaria domingensis]